MKKNVFHDRLAFWGFVGPVLITFIMVVIIPFAMGLYYSFTDWSAIPDNPINYIGFQNYMEVFNDEQFIISFKATIIYTMISVLLINIIGFTLALLVTRKLKTSNLLRTTFFMPNLIGGIILGYVWRFIFMKVFVALASSTGIGFFGLPWLSDATHAIWAMAIVSTWQMGGYIMVIYVAALQGIPEDLLEAAQIDGANAWHRIKAIIFPLVAQAFTVSLFLTISSSFKMFDVNAALTKGDPSRLTELLTLEIYNKAFIESKFGVGQAQAVILFLLISVVSLTQVYLSKKREVEM
ncbi:carbohydrate ABC transporter permease [Vallitalea okinawensis]|uniref:carbohydrate ABC transporter permease n=1 Tax=Vallitalea okinawensis TaxID=2078660 RepID=UPI000CFC0A9C|nr:sugar ABC transporter permease [Vallitalea okinawensis]